jgi:hypothetical protein
MTKYRKSKQQPKDLKAHPKIFVWVHTEKAEINYFQEFKHYLKTALLLPRKAICWSPSELIEKVIAWKEKDKSGKQKFCEEDGDQIWCVFDVDDFYQKEPEKMLKAIKIAHSNNIKIAYSNECFELWFLLHFEKPSGAIERGSQMGKKINKFFKKYRLGTFKKNQKIFSPLLPFQAEAIKHAYKITDEYGTIKWSCNLSGKGNPSTSIHFLIQEIINKLSNS